jgi:hypothetical protein
MAKKQNYQNPSGDFQIRGRSLGGQERRHATQAPRSPALIYGGWIMKVKEFFDNFDINPISANPLHGPITPELIEFIQKSNSEKRQRSIDLLGDKWLLHPKNYQQKEVNVRS